MRTDNCIYVGHVYLDVDQVVAQLLQLCVNSVELGVDFISILLNSSAKWFTRSLNSPNLTSRVARVAIDTSRDATIPMVEMSISNAYFVKCQNA